MITKFGLNTAELDRMLSAAIGKAFMLGLNVSIAIVDEGGNVFRVYRSQDAGLITPTVALAKARTAALLRAPSGMLTARLKDEPELLRLTEFLPMPGGLPVRYEGAVIGGVGVSGGNGQQDEAVAQAALDSLG